MPAAQQLFIETLPNGMTILGEAMPWLESAAFSLAVPAGCQYDPNDRPGLANFTCEMVERGCGSLDSRQYIEHLEMLGVDSGSSVSVYHTHFAGAVPAENLLAGLSVFADVVRRPLLPESQLDDGRQVCIQEIRSVEDDLAQRVMLLLRLRQYGQPLGRWSHGTEPSVRSISHADIRDFHQRYYQPGKSILAVAGKIEWPRLIASVTELFGDWSGQHEQPAAEDGRESGIFHIPFDSHQAHIGVACPSLPVRHPDYFLARCAAGVLSDGMSSRLFRELREKRGLCYTVFASLHSVLDRACLVSYVGTGADRAQQSLEALVEQLTLLRDGVEAEELNRLKTQVRSSLVMQQESCRARAAAMAGDWLHLGRVRTLDEINALIAGLEVERMNAFLRDNPLEQFNVVTLGPKELELNHGILPSPAG